MFTLKFKLSKHVFFLNNEHSQALIKLYFITLGVIIKNMHKDILLIERYILKLNLYQIT